jgi:hypothetical protein
MLSTGVNKRKQYKKNLISLLIIKPNKKRNFLKTLIRLLINKSLLLNIILTIISNAIRLDLSLINLFKFTVKTLKRPLF